MGYFMSPSWNEIRSQVSNFAGEWKDRAPKTKEETDVQDFQTDFHKVFCISRRQVVTFEHWVNMSNQTDLFGGKTQGCQDYIDLPWDGRITIEMKTPDRIVLKHCEVK